VTEQLDLARFRALADAYGGSLARWPAAYRSAATRLAATSEGADVLAAAAMLDDRLDAWRDRPVTNGLSARIVAGAPMSASLASRARLWWSGIGVAAALAGAAAGTAAVLVTVPADQAVDGGTSFGELADAGDDL